MRADQRPETQIPSAVLRHWGVTPIEYLGGIANTHWLVESGRSRLVLRGYPPEPFGDIAYELEVMRRLRGLGWPIPAVVQEPMQAGGRTWCLFTWLPGVCRSLDSNTEPAEKRARGRLLAALHDATAGLKEMGQRGGFACSDAVVYDPELVVALRAYERRYPTEGHVMRWHLDQTHEAFASIAVDTAETLVLHGDFTPWNLLFEGEKLTGVLDFEATHRNYRVADFALSWRGVHDEVIEGYQEVRELTSLDWELLVPAYWSWIFLGLTQEINAVLSGNVPPHDFAWQVRHLMRRSGLLGRRAPRYPGRASRTGGS